MGNFSGSHIDSYEKKLSVRRIYGMCREGRIVFPVIPWTVSPKKTEKISETVELLLLGVALPIVYVSERQDGSLVVLDGDDRLRYLVEFLERDYPVRGMEFFPELNGCGMEEMERKFPGRASFLYDRWISFQIIEYTTERYLHLQVGNYIGGWSFTREQGVRNELYGERLERFLSSMVKELGRSAWFFSRWNLNRQYMVLRILMYRFVFCGEIQNMQEDGMGLQELLDRTVSCIMKRGMLWEEEFGSDLRDATRVIGNWEREADFDLTADKGKEQQARKLGYLYNAVWMCREWRLDGAWGLRQIAFDEGLWQSIFNDKVNFANIRRHYYEIRKRL